MVNFSFVFNPTIRRICMEKIILTLVLYAIGHGPLQATELAFQRSVVPHVKADCYYVDVIFENLSKDILYIHKGDPELTILDTSGKAVRYRGPIVDFGRDSLSNYDQVPPGYKLSKRILLNNYYAFARSGWYRVHTFGGYVDPINERVIDKPMKLARFFFDRKKSNCLPSDEDNWGDGRLVSESHKQ